MAETIKYTNGDITFIPTKEGAAIYNKKNKVLDLSLENAQSLMICFLDFANDMTPRAPKVTKGVKKPKTSKHAKAK